MICDKLITFANSEFGSSLIGAIATIWAVRATISYENNKQKIHEIEETRAVCNAIKTEMYVGFEKYFEVGEDLEKLQDGSSFDIVYRVEEDYFTVFNSNSSQLGKLSQDVREKIIRAYVEVKSLFDTYRLNNENIDNTQFMIQKLIEIHIANGIDGEIIKDQIEKQLKTYQDIGRGLATNLKAKHFKTKLAFEEALNVLKEY